MKIKKYYIDLINHTKIIKESETLNSDGDIDLYLQLSPSEHSSNKMTINELAKIMNDRFDLIEKRLDEHDVILKEHSMILKEHSMILKEHSEIFARNNLK